MDPLIIVFGLGVGLLVGLTGLGGGSVMTPLLILVFGVKPVLAVGTDLAYGAVTKTVGGWQHWRQRTVSMRISAWLAVGSLPGAVGGVYVLERLHAAYGDRIDAVVMGGMAGAVLVTAAIVLARALFLPRAREREREEVDPMTTRHRAAAAAIGLAVGFVLGVTSVGSGALIAVGLILVFRLTPRRVVGTDVFHAAILLWVAAFAHLVAGNVDFALMGNILLGSVPGVWIGAKASGRLPEAGLRLALAGVLLAAGIGLSVKAGAEVPAEAMLAAPVLAVAAAYAVSRLHARRAAGRRGRPVPEPAPSTAP